ncbi:MarR family winged helix-turn-helix transcriptional regulator [Amycolatopsis jejuensis]|uniref:MarR family winged helix-turn-helix transcriptional regulator n=1 Tax=Amycolatopsis jejuensis TaxID=330084 RepID=UPI000526E4E9|nr:MarR family transcriptional regulator [Amycolatopsis jejuensis]
MSSDFVDALIGQWETELPEEHFESFSVVSRIARYLRLVNRQTNANLERFGFQETQFNLLCALRRAGAPHQLSPKELATSMLVTSGAITYVIDQMESAGCVERIPDPRDRRALLVRLTGEGTKRVEEAMRAHLQLCDELLAPLDATGRRDLTDALRALLIGIDDTAPPSFSAGEGK